MGIHFRPPTNLSAQVRIIARRTKLICHFDRPQLLQGMREESLRERVALAIGASVSVQLLYVI